MHSLLHHIDSFTERSGSLLAWLALLMALLTGAIVVMRYGFNAGSIASQELVTYFHATLFTVGAAFALKRGAHVRVDIFYRHYSARTQAWVNALGGVVFLLPLCLFTVVISWQFVSEAWSIREASAEAGGMPAVFLLKTLIPLFAVNLLLQGLAETIRNTLILVDPEQYG